MRKCIVEHNRSIVVSVLTIDLHKIKTLDMTSLSRNQQPKANYIVTKKTTQHNGQKYDLLMPQVAVQRTERFNLGEWRLYQRWDDITIFVLLLPKKDKMPSPNRLIL